MYYLKDVCCSKFEPVPPLVDIFSKDLYKLMVTFPIGSNYEDKT